MAKITPRKEDNTVIVKTKQSNPKATPGAWWNAHSKSELCEKLLSTVSFLKEQNMHRYRQASVYARLYGNMPISGAAGANLTRISTKNILPSDRPTMSVITSCVDTIVSRLIQERPKPTFLTDQGDYRQRNLAQQLNRFIEGEFYQTKLYEKRKLMIRDACVWGTGVLKVLEDQNKRVSLERRLATQLLVDHNEAFIGDPRQFYEMQLIDRSVLADIFPDQRSKIEKAEQAFPDNYADSDKTAADQVMLAEAWHLPSGPDAGDGMHVIACTSGIVLEEVYNKQKFPFIFSHYSEAQAGFWGQGIAERQMGTQNAINQLLMTIHRSINLVGVPRVFVEDGSKVVKAHLNNEIGSIVTYRGTKPSYEVAPCVPVELYQQLERLIQYAYQQEGISQLVSSSQKPAGLNSGEAIRQYEDIQTDRLSTLSVQQEEMVIESAAQIIDKAMDIAERDGKYQTVYPNKDGTQEIDLPRASLLKENPFVIRCYDVSSLPKDPAGRLAKVTEMMQAGLVTPEEGRRLLAFPDIEQQDKLATASEERILKTLDQIVHDGKFTPPDPFMKLDKAVELVVQYYNLYVPNKLEEKRAQYLRDFYSQCLDLIKQATPPPMAPQPGMPGAGAPQASPEPVPTNPMIPNVPQ